MEWKKDTTKHSNGKVLMLGMWNVGSIQYNSLSSKTDNLKYVASCRLPGIEGSIGKFETADEAKLVVETAVKYWLSKIPK
jgi:hypothetical protein